MNPTQAVFEERMAALEGGVAALAVASGQAAETIALLNLAENGGHIVSSASLYGGTYNLFHYTLPKLGIEVSFIDDPDDLDCLAGGHPAQHQGVLRRDARQPEGRRSRLRGRLRVAHEHGIPLVVDNTVATPYLAQPLRHGADIVVHSATKFIGGHGTSIGGVIVDGGAFDYEGSGRFPGFTEPDPSYHGLVFGQLPEALFPARFVLKARLQYLRDTGPSIAPLNSFLFLQGLETLSLRMERHVQNAQAVAEWLEARDEVSWVAYPGLPPARGTSASSSTCPRAAEPSSPSASPAGPTPGERFIEGLELFSHLANVGDVRSLAIHPGVDDALPADRGGAGDHRRHPRPGPPVHRPRVDRGHPGRPRGRVPCRQGSVTPAAPRRRAGCPATIRAVGSSPCSSEGDGARRSRPGAASPEVDRGLRDVGRARCAPGTTACWSCTP